MRRFFKILSAAMLLQIVAAGYSDFDSDFQFDECSGENCPYKQGQQIGEISKYPCNGTEESITVDPEDCHSYLYCPPGQQNGSALSFKCPPGYAFCGDVLSCIPEQFVDNCSKVYCPPSMYDGVVPHPTNCAAYYRCINGYPLYYECRRGTVFDGESGRCKRYRETPDCLKKKPNPTTAATTTTTEMAVTMTTTPTPDQTTVAQTTNPETVSEIPNPNGKT